MEKCQYFKECFRNRLKCCIQYEEKQFCKFYKIISIKVNNISETKDIFCKDISLLCQIKYSHLMTALKALFAYLLRSQI